MIDRGTVVIRDGVIVAVGSAVTAPADARTIDASGLTVYPGFIDAYSNLGYPPPKWGHLLRFDPDGGVQVTPTLPSTTSLAKAL